MTIFATTCFAFAVIRFMEECLRFCFNFISRLTSKGKAEKASNSEYKRLVATVTPEMHEVIKLHCTLTGVTITQYTLNAVIEKLKRDKVIE
jgi:hypothetical protein